MKRSTPATRIVAMIAESNDGSGLRKGAGAAEGRRVLRGPRGARGRVARCARRRAGLLPGARARRGRLVPGQPRAPDRLRAPTREGRAAARTVRADTPRARRRGAPRAGRGGTLPRAAAAPSVVDG